MAYYDALISSWNSSTQPPPGVSGTALSSSMTTAQKLTAVNGWTTTGPVIPMIIPTYKVYNLISPTEFTNLSSNNQQLVRDILGMGTVDASSGTQIRSRMISIFPNGTQTFASLSSLAASYDTPVVNWCYANKYPSFGSGGPGNLSQPDCTNAGLS